MENYTIIEISQRYANYLFNNIHNIPEWMINFGKKSHKDTNIFYMNEGYEIWE